MTLCLLQKLGGSSFITITMPFPLSLVFTTNSQLSPSNIFFLPTFGVSSNLPSPPISSFALIPSLIITSPPIQTFSPWNSYLLLNGSIDIINPITNHPWLRGFIIKSCNKSIKSKVVFLSPFKFTYCMGVSGYNFYQTYISF